MNRNLKNNSGSSFIFAYVLVIVMALSFAGGYYYSQSNIDIEINENTALNLPTVKNKRKTASFLKEDVAFDVYWETWNMLQRKFVDQPVLETELFYGSLKGMVNSLEDPYTVFFDPDETKEFKDDLHGSFEGIGAEVSMRSGVLIIISPLKESPAEKAGLLPNDYVLSIDDKDTLGVRLDDLVKLLKGPKNTPVVLTVFREGEEETKEITVIRDTINIESVEWETKNDDVAYISLSTFADDTESLFIESINWVKENNYKKIILDLRNNPGGYLNTAINILGYWVNDDIVVQEMLGDGSIRKYKSKGNAELADFKTVVLVNEGSASASEIVSGALQDYDLATVVGAKTFGKGSVQSLEELSDGSSLKVTITKWLTPKGRSIDGEGIKPTIKASLTKDDRDKELDPQLDKALEILSK